MCFFHFKFHPNEFLEYSHGNFFGTSQISSRENLKYKKLETNHIRQSHCSTYFNVNIWSIYSRYTQYTHILWKENPREVNPTEQFSHAGTPIQLHTLHDLQCVVDGRKQMINPGSTGQINYGNSSHVTYRTRSG